MKPNQTVLASKVIAGHRDLYSRDGFSRWENKVMREGYDAWLKVMRVSDPKKDRGEALTSLYGEQVDQIKDGDGRKVRAWVGQVGGVTFVVWYAPGRGVSLEVDENATAEETLAVVEKVSEQLVAAFSKV